MFTLEEFLSFPTERQEAILDCLEREEKQSMSASMMSDEERKILDTFRPNRWSETK
jgi:hypothetical protein